MHFQLQLHYRTSTQSELPHGMAVSMADSGPFTNRKLTLLFGGRGGVTDGGSYRYLRTYRSPIAPLANTYVHYLRTELVSLGRFEKVAINWLN